MSPATPPTPDLEPLQLLYVTNGSPLTADRWWLAHHYYQHRQNLHYQSLHQPGIVQGLGVRAIAGPDTVPSELRDDRWIEIQPGLAIDLVGNPIVVDAPMTFRVTAAAIEAPVTVYIVLAYVNPRDKQWSGIPADVVREEFRINERTTPPAASEIELCRIHISRNQVSLKNAASGLQPYDHELDLRHRQHVQPRSPHSVQVGLVETAESPYRDRLLSLLQAVEALYPALSGSQTPVPVSLADPAHPESPLPDVTVLFLPYASASRLSDAAVDQVRTYIERGGTVLIEYTDDLSDRPIFSELQAVQAELHQALADLSTVDAESELERVRQDLTTEVTACEAAIQEQLQAIAQPLTGLTLGHPPSPALVPTQTPFLFDELPRLPTGAIQLMAWDGIILIVGSLSAAWTRPLYDQPLPRATLRDAHELGINLLHQAERRQRIIQAQQPSASRETEI